MRCKVGMLLICIAIMELAGCAFINPISASEGEPVVYQDLLSEYERVMKDTTYTEEQWSANIYDHVKRYIGKEELYYCVKDLVGDGRPELILGTMREGEYEILGTVYEEGCEPFIIYTYDDAGAKWVSISEEYIMTIYKGGIVELISGGVDTHFMYEQIEKDEVFEKTLNTIVCRQIKDEEPYYYKYKMENGKYVDGEYEELSEDEFYNIRNQYTAVREELEWKPVEGFWDVGILEQNSITSKEIDEIQESGEIIHESGLAEDTTCIENIESASQFESIVEVIENNNVAILTQKIKELLQNNLLEGFTFLESEKALCYYLKKEPSDMYVFAVCKEDLSGDIIHERDVYVAKETGRIYRKDEGTLIPLEINVPRGIRLPDVTRNVWNYEPELVYSEDGTSFQIIYGEEGAEVLDQMLDFIEQEEGLENYKIMYYGECTFFDRRYHEMNLVESSDTHVHIVKRYYIDAQNGNVYEEPEDWYMDSEIALHYIGNVGEAEDKLSGGSITIDQVNLHGRTEKETALIQKILSEDKEEFQEFLTADWEFPHEQEAILLTAYDFTGDGKDEIIVSKFYINIGAPLAYNYVYDQNGRRVIEFVGSHPLDTQIIAGWNGEGTFMLCNMNHYSAHNNASIYTEIRCEDDMLTEKVILMELDRREGDYEGNDEYYIFKDFTKEEEEKLWYGSFGVNELTKTKAYVREDKEFEEYTQLFDKAETTGVTMIGVILYSESDNRFVEYAEGEQ